MRELGVKVSVIVPMYNVQPYIEKCIFSILNSTLKDIEIIIVNDGSTDKSVEIIEKFTYLQNVTLINQENKGVAAARNTGIKNARGEYISFIDSDDYIKEDFLAKLYTSAKKDDLDLVTSGYYKLFKDNKKQKVKRKKELISNNVMKGDKFLHIFLKDYYVEVYCTLYKKKFLMDNNLYFYEGVIHEDELFTPLCYLKAERVKMIDYYGYIYRQTPGSIMNSKRNETRKLDSLLIIIQQFLEIFQCEMDEKNKKILSRLISHTVYKYEKILYSDNIRDKREFIIQLSKIKPRYYMNFNKELSFKLNIRYFIVEHFPRLYHFLWKYNSIIKSKS